ncbi:hypothetical protein DFH11DRAFT_1539299 [Phellopilus nigrolimitatus]|nr:hypothetical protein DFH11DRAFT_1539299 [Phellopilus nigrolimitatus]
MADRPVPPPLPPIHRSRVSFSMPHSPSTESSNIHSGESWSNDSSFTSYSSNSSKSPLPKGARPPSPQSTRPSDHPSSSETSAKSKSASSPKRSGTLSSWKVEWRGVSKIVRWAVLGDRLESEDKSTTRRRCSGSRRRHSDGGNPLNKSGPRLFDKPLPEKPSEPGYAPYFCASPTSPLSPSTSTTCVDIAGNDCPGVLYPGTELDHGGSPGPAHYGEQFPSISQTSSCGRCGSLLVSKHENHVRRNADTNVQRAASEQDHSRFYGTHFDAGYTFSDAGHSAASHESIHLWTQARRIAHSDIGHVTDSGMTPYSACPSALALSNGFGLLARIRRESASFWVLSISTISPYPTPTTDARESFGRALGLLQPLTPQTDVCFRLPYRCTLRHRHMYHRLHEHHYILSSSAPPTPPKPLPRPPRKLTKRLSPALPPLPRIEHVETADIPPPVPPKPTSILKNKLETPSSPLSSTSPQSSGYDTTIPALTDTSASTSHTDEPFASQESSDTSNSADNGRPSKRPSLLRTESNRRWTVAVADVPDDLFLEELERLRRMGLRAGEVHSNQNQSASPFTPPVIVGRYETHTCVNVGRHSETNWPEKGKMVERNTVIVQEVGAEDETEWLHARRAIMCCRELVRTERSYQARLQELADGSVSDAVPTLLTQYLPALISASQVLSAQFNEDMTASGVSNAFINSEATIENAFVAWSGVVGEFFGGNRSSIPHSKRKRETTIPSVIAEEHIATEFGAVKVRCTSMDGHEQALFSHTIPTSPHIHRTRRMSSGTNMHWLLRPAFSQISGDANDEKEVFGSLRKSFRLRETRIREEREKRRKPPFRDLAILPTQRVTRYVLLYKDLLKNTPKSSPTRGLVEQAVDSAMRVATKCDRAQDNSAFLYDG